MAWQEVSENSNLEKKKEHYERLSEEGEGPLSQNVSSALGSAGYMKFSGAGMDLAASIECGHHHMADLRFLGNLGRRT